MFNVPMSFSVPYAFCIHANTFDPARWGGMIKVVSVHSVNEIKQRILWSLEYSIMEVTSKSIPKFVYIEDKVQP